MVHAIARLQRRYPLAFPKNPAPKVPLKIGIFEDLVPCAQDFSLSKAELRLAIQDLVPRHPLLGLPHHPIGEGVAPR